jgi:hypothetical protein
VEDAILRKQSERLRDLIALGIKSAQAGKWAGTIQVAGPDADKILRALRAKKKAASK